MKVFVYYNLHKKVFSVRALEGDRKGLVIAHRERVYLEDVVFRVSEAGRQRVIREQRKNVHAGAVGQWTDTCPAQYDGASVTYNPYKYESFVTMRDRTPVHRARNAMLFQRQITANIS